MKMLLLATVLLLFHATYARPEYPSDSLQQHKADSIRHQYLTSKSDTARLHSLIALTEAFEDLNDFEQMLLYNEYKKQLADKLKSSNIAGTVKAVQEGEASYYFCLATASKKQGNSRQALNYFFQALNSYTLINNEKQVAIMLSHIAATYSLMGNYSESLRYSFMSLKKTKTLGDRLQVAIELNNIGAIYCDVHYFSKALMYITLARNISRSLNDKKATALYTGNIGHCYQLLCDSAYEAGNTNYSLKLQDKALSYYLSALNISEQIYDLDNASVCLENIGILYSNINEYQKALPYFQRAFAMYETLGLKAEQSYCLVMLGQAYNATGQKQKAEASYARALEFAEQTRSNYYIMEANLGNSEFYEKQQQYGKALAYYKKYIASKDSIFNNENTIALARTELNYQFEKKEASIQFENDKMIYQLEAVNKLHRQWRWFFIVAIILVSGVLFFVKRAYDNKKKLTDLLTAEDQRKDVLLQEVHHRINNNLQIISSLLTLQARNANDEKLSEYLAQSQNRIQSLSAMHELLHDTSSPLHINMKDYISRIVDFHRNVACSIPVHIAIKEELEPANFPTKLALPLALIVNELVTNSLKYAFEGRKEGTIAVKLNRQNEGWVMTVSDNGKGLPPEGSGRENSLGLKLVHIMTRQIKGRLSAKTDNGAYFCLEFDLTNK